ncbi:RsmB/NOP family class I SAM-dependent RNA methyltransferase [Stakelama marina]|uniref:RsmB/NOP family class I SAM-dependent RNA methyltransferase n=1 Tax=Stakelama marina TaxID=2826939 RepID=A0A8T4IAE4_9SPHN|nr:RsmB/NOP family class I SAM-dependent RNA methyltransferase [Stakelama marina]MBR0551627.1 RsmB/NOP family class I SAM-dependent RNA methyltransferase [Stakelama marina]
MTPAARTQAGIEILDKIIKAARDQGAAADTIIARYFASRRYAGSQDRRAIRSLVYDAVRLLGDCPENGRAAMLALARRRPDLLEHFGAERYGPSTIAAEETPAEEGRAPTWMADPLQESNIGEWDQTSLLARAPLDIRVNPLRATIEEVERELEDAERLHHAPMGLRLPPDTMLDKHPLYRKGAFEIQDAGSQIVSLAAGAAPGMTVVDLCAGGGGKTLALAALMANRGRIVASDSDRGRLRKLEPRANRAGVSIAETRLLNPGEERDQLADLASAADIVLVDAPCSGTGTWRRNPEARWRLTPGRIENFVSLQERLIEVGAELVKPGGALVYIVCSLLDDEGTKQVEAFLERHPDWTAEKPELPAGTDRGGGVRLTPAKDSTDGFFVAKLVRPC